VFLMHLQEKIHVHPKFHMHSCKTCLYIILPLIF
jgi:hypothetical protein